MEKRKMRAYNGAVVCLQKYTLGQNVIIHSDSTQSFPRTNIPRSPACLGYFNRIDVQTIRDFRNYVRVTSQHEAEYPCSRKQLLLRRITEADLRVDESGPIGSCVEWDEVELKNSAACGDGLPFASDDGNEYALCCFSVFSINKEHCGDAICRGGFYANIAHMLYETIVKLRDKFDFRLSFMEVLGTEDLCLIVLSNQYQAISSVIEALQCFSCPNVAIANHCESCRVDNVHSILMMDRKKDDLLKRVDWNGAKAEMHFSLHSVEGMHYLNTQEKAIREYLKTHCPEEKGGVQLESCSGEYDAFLRCPAHLLPIILGLERGGSEIQGCFHPDNKVYRKRIYQSDTYLYPFGLAKIDKEQVEARAQAEAEVRKIQEEIELHGDKTFLGAPKLKEFVRQAVEKLKGNLQIDDMVEDFVFQDLPIWRMLKEYWSFASFPMGADLREDLEHQFLVSVNAIVNEAKLCGDNRKSFVEKYDEIVTAMQASMQAGSQQDRWYFGEQQSYIENVDSYYKILRCYYGMLKDMIQLIYRIPRVEGTEQPYLVPMISFGVNPLISSKAYESYVDEYVDDALKQGDMILPPKPAKLVCISLPYQALSNPLKYMGILAHEIFHYAAPADRGTRNDLMMQGLIRIAISEFITILAKNCKYPGNEDAWVDICKKDETFRVLVDKLVHNTMANLEESCNIDTIRLRDIQQMVENKEFRFTLDPTAALGYKFYREIWENMRMFIREALKKHEDNPRSEFAGMKALESEFLALYQDMFDLKEKYVVQEEPAQIDASYRAKTGPTTRRLTTEFRSLMKNAYKAMEECPPDIFDLEVVMHGKSPEEKIHQFLWQQYSAKRDLLIRTSGLLNKNNIRTAMIISFYLNEKYDKGYDEGYEGDDPPDSPAHLRDVMDRWIREGFKDNFDIARKTILKEYEAIYHRFRWLFSANQQICTLLAQRIRTQLDGTSDEDSIKVRLTGFYESYYQILRKFQNDEIKKEERHDMLFRRICDLIDAYQKQERFEVQAPTSAKMQEDKAESAKTVKFVSAADDKVRFVCDEEALSSSDLLYKLQLVCDRMSVNEKLPMLWYRGQARKKWPVIPNIMRLDRCKTKTPDEGFAQMLRYQKLMAQARILPVGQNLSDAEWIAFLQHYGFKTNTLDFSESIVPALYFATEKWSDKVGHVPEEDAVIMVFNPVLFNLAMDVIEKTEQLKCLESALAMKTADGQDLDGELAGAKARLQEIMAARFTEQDRKNLEDEQEELEKKCRWLSIACSSIDKDKLLEQKKRVKAQVELAEKNIKRYLQTGISYEQPPLLTSAETDGSLSYLYDLNKCEEADSYQLPRAVMVPRHCERMDKQLGEFVYYNIATTKRAETVAVGQTDEQKKMEKFERRYERFYSYSDWALERLHEKYVQYCRENIKAWEAKTGKPVTQRFVPFLAKIVINRYRYQGFKRCVLAMGMQRFSVYPEYDKLAEDLRDQLDLK